MNHQRGDLLHNQLNRLTAVHIASTAILLLMIAILAILQAGWLRSVSRRVAALEAAAGQERGEDEERAQPPSGPAAVAERSSPAPAPEPPDRSEEPSENAEAEVPPHDGEAPSEPPPPPPPVPPTDPDVTEEEARPTREAESRMSAVERARAQLRAGDPNAAARTASRALAGNPRDAEMLEVLGAAMLARGDPAAAESAWRAWIREVPSEPRAHDALGRALLSGLRHAEAVTVFREAIRLAPDQPLHWFHLGAAQLNGDALAEAIGSFDEALRLDEQLATAHFARAVALARVGRGAEAERSLARALALDAELLSAAEQVEAFRSMLSVSDPPASDGAGGAPPPDAKTPAGVAPVPPDGLSEGRWTRCPILGGARRSGDQGWRGCSHGRLERWAVVCGVGDAART
jgi:tetratricopeptide (TPR) repeat protein